jgi:hypothetical protein
VDILALDWKIGIYKNNDDVEGIFRQGKASPESPDLSRFVSFLIKVKSQNIVIYLPFVLVLLNFESRKIHFDFQKKVLEIGNR